jgi:PIN domain nuclease of toxin-antitoxin system
MPDPQPSYITDAHPLLWHLANDPRLSNRARAVLAEADAGRANLIIPAVALAEMLMVVEKGRLPIPPADLAESIRRWQAARNVELASLTPDVVLAAMRLTAIPEIFDRLIVAEVRARGLPIITKDEDIAGSGLVSVIW